MQLEKMRSKDSRDAKPVLVCTDKSFSEIRNMTVAQVGKNGIIAADYSFCQIATNGTSIMDDNYNLAFGLHRIAYATQTDVAEIVNYVEFVGYLCQMPSGFERLYNLPDFVWCPANARGLAKSKNIVNRVVSFRLSSMTEVEGE